MTLIMELVDLLKVLQDQIDKKSKLDQNFLINFVNPLWENFNAVHNDYLASFGKYIEIAQDKKSNSKSLIERIHQDSIYSANIRSDLFNLIDAMDSRLSKKFMERFELIIFLSSIKSYFSLQENIPYSINQVNDHEWILISGQTGFYDWENRSQEEIWKLTKDKKSQRAIEIIYRKMPSNGKANININPDNEKIYSQDKNDIIVNVERRIDKSNIKNKEDLLLIEWGGKIIELMTPPAANFPRAVMLSALVLNQNTPKSLLKKSWIDVRGQQEGEKRVKLR